jgi:hypothetical protein
MKNLVFALVGTSLSAGLFVAASPAEAGPFDRIKKAVRDVEEVAKDVEDTVEAAETVRSAVENGSAPRIGTRGITGGRGAAVEQAMRQRSNYPKTAEGKPHAGRAGAVPAKFTQLTKCGSHTITNAMIGQLGKYTWQNGLNEESGTGLLNRETVSAKDGCIMPSLGTYDTLYFEVPTAQLAKYKRNYEMQCINASTGKMNEDNLNPSAHNVKGKDIMLHHGNSAGYTPTAGGSISDRSGAWDADLKKRGMTMFGFMMPALHTDSGTDFYCQYYNDATGESIAAFMYRRSAGNR